MQLLNMYSQFATSDILKASSRLWLYGCK